MENKKNSKKTVKLLVVLIALLLIACSLLGFTLARYFTERTDGQGGVNIAYWNIADDGQLAGTGDVRATLSPNKEERDSADEFRTRTVSAEGATALVITNNSAVEAKVTLTISSGLVFYNIPEEGQQATEVNNVPTVGAWDGVTLSQIIGFTGGETAGSGITVTYGEAGSETGTTEPADTTTSPGNAIFTATLSEDGGWMKVALGQITWTSDFTGDTQTDATNNVWEGDVRDTWIGENVGSVGFAYSWIAEQASQVPDGGVSEPTP